MQTAGPATDRRTTEQEFRRMLGCLAQVQSTTLASQLSFPDTRNTPGSFVSQRE